MIKVLHIITELELGGAQSLTLNVLRNLNHTKFDTYLLSSPKGLLLKDAKNLKNTAVFLTPFLKRNINPLFDIIAFIIIFFYILRNDIDIVHTHSSKAGILGRWAAKLAKVPVIIHTYHGFGFNLRQKWITRIFFIFLERLTSNITTRLIFVSKNNQKKAKKLNIGDDNNTLIYGAIEKKKFLNIEYKLNRLKQELGAEESEKIVGMIAPLKPQKAPEDFVRIAKKVSYMFGKVKFFLIGDGILRSRIEKMIDKLELRDHVFLLGWRKDIDKIMPVFDVVILTSYWEGLPHSLLEAMVCKKPVVGYGVDGIVEIIEDEVNGFIVQPGDINTFSDRIFQLLKDNQLSQKIGNNGYAMIKDRFNINETLFLTEQLYLELLNGT